MMWADPRAGRRAQPGMADTPWLIATGVLAAVVVVGGALLPLDALRRCPRLWRWWLNQWPMDGLEGLDRTVDILDPTVVNLIDEKRVGIAGSDGAIRHRQSAAEGETCLQIKHCSG